MENLEDIKVGDKVIVSKGCFEIVKIVKELTTDKVKLDDGKIFNKNTGYAYGFTESVFTERIRRATIKDLSEIRKSELLVKVQYYPWDKLSTEELEKVYELINK